MSKFGKIFAFTAAVAGGVMICAVCPAAAGALGKLAVMTAPSIGEIIAEEGIWPPV